MNRRRTTKARPHVHTKPPSAEMQRAGVVCDALLHSTDALTAGNPRIGVLALAMALGCYAHHAGVGAEDVLELVRGSLKVSAALYAEKTVTVQKASGVN